MYAPVTQTYSLRSLSTVGTYLPTLIDIFYS